MNKKKGSESIRNKKKEVNQSGIKKNVTNYQNKKITSGVNKFQDVNVI